MLYDFDSNRIPQALRHVLAYLVERYGIELPVPLGPTANGVPAGHRQGGPDDRHLLGAEQDAGSASDGS